MIPEKGNPGVHITAAAVCDGFRAAGAQPCDTVLYHGSLSSMGTVEGGPVTVIDGVLEAVGPEGTVAMPTLWYHDAELPMNPEDFDVETSSSYVGALSEAFRGDPRSVRSNHFSHSVSAIGARAVELTADHGAGGLYHTPWSPKAFADVSPWGRLYEWNALYCFIGVTLRVCTMKHYVEARMVAEYLAHAPESARSGLKEQLSAMGHAGVWPYFDSQKLGEELEAEGAMGLAKIGSATLRAVRTRTLVDEAFKRLRAEPKTWFNEAFMAWREACLSG